MNAPESWDPTLDCRALDSDDAEALLALFVRCASFFELVGAAPGDEEVDDFLTDCPPDRTEEDLFCFGVFAGDDLVAAASTFRDYPSHGCWWIGLFVVDPDVRGVGVGRSFYDALASWFADQGAHGVQLGVQAPNEGGRHFWERLGFEFARPGRPVVEGVRTPVPTDVLAISL